MKIRYRTIVLIWHILEAQEGRRFSKRLADRKAKASQSAKENAPVNNDQSKAVRAHKTAALPMAPPPPPVPPPQLMPLQDCKNIMVCVL